MHTTIHIEINGHRHEVHHHEVTGLQIKEIGHHEHGQVYRLDQHGHRQLIADDEKIKLSDGERFEIASHPPHAVFIIEVDGKPYKTERHRLTGAEIKALAKRPAGNNLYRLVGQQRVPVADDEIVEIHEHERFVTFPPHGHAS